MERSVWEEVKCRTAGTINELVEIQLGSNTAFGRQPRHILGSDISVSHLPPRSVSAPCCPSPPSHVLDARGQPRAPVLLLLQMIKPQLLSGRLAAWGKPQAPVLPHLQMMKAPM